MDKGDLLLVAIEGNKREIEMKKALFELDKKIYWLINKMGCSAFEKQTQRSSYEKSRLKETVDKYK